MRKIILRIDTTFLVHKSKEITSRKEYYFFVPIQEITIFSLPVYILIPNISLLSFSPLAPAIWLFFLSFLFIISN